MKGGMNLNVPDEDAIPVNELARAIDKHISTILRWGSPRGVRGRASNNCRNRLACEGRP